MSEHGGEPRKITLAEWDRRYPKLKAAGLAEPAYGGPLGRHVSEGGDRRLTRLRFDDSPAALRLWNFLLTEEERLRAARAGGEKLVGAMKDLGTVPVMAYSLPGVRAFYPDGAWWIPCVMELDAGLLAIADELGLDESFCPVRAMLGAFVTGAHFPRPDLLVCSAGAVCDDFSAVAQRLQGLGYPILWWEVPHRRAPEDGEAAVPLPGGGFAPASLAALVREELGRVAGALSALAGEKLDEGRLAAGIAAANRVRFRLRELRRVVFTAPAAPLPALELLIAEMLAIHFCSDRAETIAVLDDLLAEAKRRVKAGQGTGPADAVRLFWVNPPADLRAMNFLEECGGRLGGTEFLFPHALDPLPTDVPPLEALARAVLADPMVGPAGERADRVVKEAKELGAEAILVSRIPGASHCATEGAVIAAAAGKAGLPLAEVEIPPLADSLLPFLGNRLEALLETARGRR